ncbi:MAG: type VII secretion integral membrane protein EccD [Streptomyces sp.]|uniref:type VII secretion integral membrane protein EccD n=1 Tax=Streptomyces sp. TaxID=1931 RepID=UPI0025D87D3E|nr:type VII secretion integral membrane protein EccD [Streptomyces sp.]MBW8792681.1 type VII secretion integral membrane protein EccD [Streptomyces sp.]
MTAAASASRPPFVPGTGVVRLTVEGPRGRADLAVPVATTVSALLLALGPKLPDDQGDDSATWTLQRLGEEPLAPDDTPYSAGLRHGEVLQLRPAHDPLPGFAFDDVADGIARTVQGRSDRWRPELTRAMTLAVACLALGGLTAAALRTGVGRAPSVVAGCVAVLLALACLQDNRTPADRAARIVAGSGACLFAALGGITALHGPAALLSPGYEDVLLGAAYPVVIAVLLLFGGRLPALLPAAVCTIATLTAVCAGLVMARDWTAAQAVTVVAVAVVLLGHWMPWMALRAARLRVPQLPHDSEELQRDIAAEPAERIARRVAVAEVWLDVTAIGTAAVATAATGLLAHQDGWGATTLALVLGAAMLLRAWSQIGVWQRGPSLLGGAASLTLVAIYGPAGLFWHIGSVLLLLSAAVGLLNAARRPPTARLLPVWGRLGEVLELVVALALLPLLLQVLGAYAHVRSMTG